MTIHLILLIGAAITPSQQGSNKSLPPWSDEKKQAISRETRRYRDAIVARKFHVAEKAIIQLEAYDYIQLGATEMHIELELWRQDYSKAFSYLKSFYEPTQPCQTKLRLGGEQRRLWYWFLTYQSGDLKKADAIQANLFEHDYNIPKGMKPVVPANLSNSKLAQVYMYMSCFGYATNKDYRALRYLALARKVDPSTKVDPMISYAFSLYTNDGTLEKYEAMETIPMLDHIAYEKKTGRRVRI